MLCITTVHVIRVLLAMLSQILHVHHLKLLIVVNTWGIQLKHRLVMILKVRLHDVLLEISRRWV
jgi:hypothetical protein